MSVEVFGQKLTQIPVPYLDNNEELVVGSEEVSLRSVERSLVLAPLEAWLGAAAGDTLHNCSLAHLHLNIIHSSFIPSFTRIYIYAPHNPSLSLVFTGAD